MQTGSGTGYQAQVTQTIDVCYRGSPKTLVWETGPLSKEPRHNEGTPTKSFFKKQYHKPLISLFMVWIHHPLDLMF